MENVFLRTYRSIVRPIPERGSIQLSGRGFETLMQQNQAKVGERGRGLADKLMRVFARLDSMVEVPKLRMTDRVMHYPLSVVFAPREVPCVARCKV